MNKQLDYTRAKQKFSQEKHQITFSVAAINIELIENIGSILRLADAAHASKVLFFNENTLPIKEAKLTRIARHANKTVDWKFVDHSDALELDKKVAVAVEITSESTNIFTTQLPKNPCFVVGSERQGIPEDVLQQCVCTVHIPMFGNNSSMNVSQALGIVIYEFVRQQAYATQKI